MDLLVRAGRNDHTVIDHFLTPSSAGIFGASQPVDAVVADATVAVARPQLRRITSDAGVPYVIDPVTPLLQSEQPADDNWASLPFAQTEPLLITDLNEYLLDEIIEKVISFQREAGATHLIPPYLYSNKRDDPWWRANLALLHRTGAYLAAHNIDSPVIPVLAVSLRAYGPAQTWDRGLDSYLRATKDLNTESVALSWSWNDPAHSKDAMLSLLLGATSHAASVTSVVGWRSGTYGLAMAAAGAGGYETGIGSREYLHYVQLAQSKRPKPPRPDDEPRLPAYVYVSEFGRSVQRRAAKALLHDPRIAGSLVCSPENFCCLGGADSMIENWREHTVRERRRELNQLAAMPSGTAWRMHHIEQRAERAHTLAVTANEILTNASVDVRMPVDTFASLRRVAAALRSQQDRRVA